MGLHFVLLSILILVSTFTALIFNQYLFLAIPGVALVGFIALFDLRFLYLMLWSGVIISTEFQISGGFGTDLPSEPLAILLIGIASIWFLKHYKQVNLRNLFHPLTILILLHFGWICVTALTSGNSVVSIKYALAKSWYLGAYFVLPFLFLTNGKMLKKWIWFITIPLVLTVIWVMARHSQFGFSFTSISTIVSPFYRNHVNYACTLAIFLPFIFWLFTMTKNVWQKRFLVGSMAFILIALYFSYTRAAYLCIPLMIGYYVVVRFKLTKFLVAGALIAGVVFVVYMSSHNKYLDFAPNYDRTISHTQFNDLLSATYKLEDISTMERFYRWIAGFYMIKEKPITGYGPGNFYNYYHSYTDRNFVTYVSDNPEKSSTHNYYLMIAVEQGMIGILIFICLIASMLLYGERVFHQYRAGPQQYLVYACLASIVSILFILLLNDMIETDKVGAIFFTNAALIIALHLRWIKFAPEK